MSKIYCVFDKNYLTVERGDTFFFPIKLNQGDTLNSEKYTLSETDKLYIGIMQPGESFENAIIRKTITNKSEVDEEENPLLILDSKDTEYLLTGKYFITIKLSQQEENKPKITTVLPMKEFFITGTDKHINKNIIKTQISVDEGKAPEWIPT